jgi:hypothetical protein
MASDMLAEGAVAMMVLAVHVVGDAPPKRDLLGSGRDGRNQPRGNATVVISRAGRRPRPRAGRVGIEADEAIEPRVAQSRPPPFRQASP